MRKILICLIAVCLLVTGFSRVQAADLNSYAGAVTTDGAVLNVRAKPSTGANVVATLKKGSYITLTEKSGSWWQVEYAKGRFGYCHADFITPVQGTPVTVNVDSALNVRSGPGTGYSRQATLYRGEVVLLLTSSGGWSRVLYHGTKTGYVSSRYLSSSSLSAISLMLKPFWKLPKISFTAAACSGTMYMFFSAS